MSELATARPSVTVACVIEDAGRYLLVEEATRAGLRLNQPAGHLESGETLGEGAIREALEETGWDVALAALIGIYRWESPDSGATFLRFSFAATALQHDPARTLDTGIVRALWLDYDAIKARQKEHRSPLVLRCIDDYLSGQWLPPDLVVDVR